jgi:hypothetical protein
LTSQIFNSKFLSNLKKFLWGKLFLSANPSKPYSISTFWAWERPFWSESSLKLFEFVWTYFELFELTMNWNKTATAPHSGLGPTRQPPHAPPLSPVQLQWKNLFFISCCVICFTLFVMIDLCDFFSTSSIRHFAPGLRSLSGCRGKGSLFAF